MRPTTAAGAETEHRVLTTEAGQALLAEASAVACPTPKDLERWRRSAPADLVSAALRLAEGRRRGAAKFSRADRMWFEKTGLEQATAEPVARHKAARFNGADVVDLCCGIGGDALGMAASGCRVLAVDRDPGMLRRARWNAAALGCESRVLPVLARAERVGIPRSCLVHVDPDRRSGAAPRAKAIAGYAPGLDFLRSLPSSCRGGAIKLGPASDFAAHFDRPGLEVELVSLEGECKEATVWFGDLASGRRRATALPSSATWADRDGPDAPAPSGPLGPWLFEPDPALVRSGLVDGYALAHGLTRVAEDLDLLTGPSRPDSPFLSSFAVEAAVPLDWKGIRAEARRLDLSPRWFKTRGLPDLRTEHLDRRFRSEGGRPATLFLLNGRSGGRAIFAVRIVEPN